MRQIQNNLAHLMKIHYKLPEKIIIILNNSILDDAALATTQLPALLQWLLTEIEAAISFRRKHLPIRCLRTGEPAVYLLKMLPRASRAEQIDLFKSIRRKVNSTIPSIISKFEFGFINVCEITTTSSLFFDRSGKALSPAGMQQFWVSISDTIKQINEEKLPKPKALTEDKGSQTPDNHTSRRVPNRPAHDNSRPSTPRRENNASSYAGQYQGRRHSYDYNTYNRFHYHRKY